MYILGITKSFFSGVVYYHTNIHKANHHTPHSFYTYTSESQDRIEIFTTTFTTTKSGYES